MLSNSTARWLQRRGIHYGWLVAAITFLTMLTMSAALGLPGAMLQPLSREFGWSTEQISSSLALRFALFGLLGPFAAVMMERFGLRAVMCMGLALVGGAMAMVTQATQLWHLFLLWSLLLGMGTGLTALVLGAVVANRWFAARRGLVIGVLTASAATGQLAFLPLAAWMIEHWGWRSATVPVFVASALIAVLALLFVRDRPSDLGLAPFGGDASAPPPPAMAMNFGTPFKVLAEAARNRTFWLLAGTFFICGLSPRPVQRCPCGAPHLAEPWLSKTCPPRPSRAKGSRHTAPRRFPTSNCWPSCCAPAWPARACCSWPRNCCSCPAGPACPGCCRPGTPT